MTAAGLVEHFTNTTPIPFLMWVFLVFCVGVISAAYQQYKFFRNALGTGMKPVPNCNLEDLIRELFDQNYSKLQDENSTQSVRLKILLKSIQDNSSLGEIMIWGRIGTAAISEIPNDHWQEFSLHKSDQVSRINNGKEIYRVNIFSNKNNLAGGMRYRDIFLNSGQVKYLKKSWRNICSE